MSQGKVTLNPQQAMQVMGALEEIGGRAVDAVNQLADSTGMDNEVRANILREMSRAIAREADAFRCPVCKRVSWNLNDARHGWCGACHRQTGVPQMGVGA